MGIEDLPVFGTPSSSDVDLRILELEQFPEERLCALTYQREREYRSAQRQRTLGYLLGVGCVLLKAIYDSEGAQTSSSILSVGVLLSAIHGWRHLPSYRQEVEYLACSKIKEKRGW